MREHTGLTFICVAAACLGGISAAGARPKTPKEQAREHFQKGQAHFRAARYLEAVRELKKAYKIRSSPDVLYFIGQTWQSAGMNEEAVLWYRRYLDESRLTERDKRASARSAVVALGGKLRLCPVAVPKAKPEAPAVKIAKARRAGPQRIIHELVMDARPHHPLLVDMELSKGFGWAKVYIYFRTKGMSGFIKKAMKPDRRGVYRYLIHRSCLRGRYLHYFIEAIGRTGRRVAASGTSISPNIVLLSATARMQTGGRMNDGGQTTCHLR